MKSKLLQEKKYNELTTDETEEVLEEAQKLVGQIGEIFEEIKEMKEKGVPFTNVGEELRNEINKIFPEN